MALFSFYNVRKPRQFNHKPIYWDPHKAVSYTHLEVSKPVKTRFGYHIIKLLDKGGIPSFEEKKKSWSRVMAQGERNFEYYKAFDERLKKEYGYVFYPEAYAELVALCNDHFPSDKDFYEKAKDCLLYTSRCV